MNRTLLGLLKTHKLASLLPFVDEVLETDDGIVLRCKNELLAKMLQDKFAEDIAEVERGFGIKVRFSYPKSEVKVFRESFENFFYGKENEFTVAALRSVALGSGTVSSVFLVGDAGMGKSHLLKATANLTGFTGRRAVYMTAGGILDRLVGSYKSGGNPDFSELRNAQVILIDDIHTLKDKVFALEFLSRIIDRAAAKGRTVIMASELDFRRFRNPPSFRTRLMSNLILRIHPHTPRVRRHILHFRLRLHGLDLPKEYVDYVVDKVHNPRALIGVVVRLRAHMDVYGSLPEFSRFRDLIADLTSEDEMDIFALFGVRDIRRKTADFYLAIYAMRLAGMSVKEISERAGCSRASVYNYIRRAKEILRNDPERAGIFNERMRLLRRDLL
ncbi:MAG: ATP-binding protein [Thermotogae bacterium]|nr:ATP-binding protein [Thermotogota bacterium]